MIKLFYPLGTAFRCLQGIISEKEGVRVRGKEYKSVIRSEGCGDAMGRSLNALDLGQTAVMTRKFTMEDVRRCMDLTGDDNQMYWDETFAQKTRYKRTIVQGLLTEGLVTALINSRIPGPGALLLNKELVFPNPVFVGESITAQIEVVDINLERRWVTEKVICTKEDGNEVIRGQIVLFVENVSG